jgi:hypothetical protein
MLPLPSARPPRLRDACLLLFCFLGAAPLRGLEAAPAHAPASQEDPRKEFERRFKAAGEDVDALWDLHLWADAYGLAKESRACLRAIIKHHPSHAKARAALGHVEYDGQWFPSESALEKYKKEEAQRLAKERGLVQHKGEWVPAEDLPYLQRGLVRDDEGNWISAKDLERLRSGWRRQDLQWIPPDEVSRLAQGLWKCGEEWKSLDEANRFHSEPERWWVVPTRRFLLHSTCDRQVIESALQATERVPREIERTFGLAVSAPVPVVLLRDARQYGRFASGEQGAGGAEVRGLSSVHHAFFADAWISPQAEGSYGAGVAYWDASSEERSAFGPFAVRHAAALSLIEAIDPSPKTLAKVVKKGSMDARDIDAFWAEKRIPEWLRYGAATYAERYYIDSFVAQGGNPHWVREWSVSNLQRRGGLRPLAQVFDSRLGVEDKADSEKLISERGLVVAFILDGGCEPVIQAHQAFVQTLKEGKDPAKALDKLSKQILQHEPQLRAFAGL